MVSIDFDDISFRVRNNMIVEGFTFHVKPGEIVTFFGPSGCGKSSIMKLVLGINIPTSGSVKIGDTIAGKYKKPISYVPQDNELLPWLSVKDNIEAWSKNSGNPHFNSDEVLALVDLQKHADKTPAMLSGGMSRRTALARGLATKSDIVCFDEAMVGIEKTMRFKLLFNLRNYIKANGITSIFISHDYEETIFLSDRIVVFTPPPTVISKVIDVSVISGQSSRDSDFVGAPGFKEVYNQMLTI